ncbi:MAG TPA: zinc-finger domain-containing protein [Stellaceae bacterium]
MQPFETIYVDSTVVACNGGGGPLGHPRVYLNLSGDGKIECPYCSRLFVLRGPQAGGHVAETPPMSPGAHPPPSSPSKP